MKEQIEAVMRLAGFSGLKEGETLMITKLPNGELNVVRMLLRSYNSTASSFSDSVQLDICAMVLDGAPRL